MYKYAYNIYIYIYIYMAVTSIGGQKNGQNLKKIPSFIVKNGQQKPPQNRGGFLLRFLFFFFHKFLCFFLFVSPYFLLFHDILEPQNSPPNEVTGYMAVYIYIYIYRVLVFALPMF